MPIKIPDNLPARKFLESEGLVMMQNSEAARQDIRSIKIALLNLMPKKEQTEMHFARLIGASPIQIELTLITTGSYTPSNAPKQHMLDFYHPWENVKDQKFDGLIVTGAPVETLPFDEVDTFDRSSTYSDRINDYNKFISNTGDINTLAMYIADNPFVVEPMFHFAMFFFSIGENDRGMELLKRILWVMESAAFSSFLHGHENDKTVHLMDREKEENGVFFSALFRLAQTSCMVGCTTTSLAISRFLLSLNPMLDPCGILMVLDYYALATMMQRDVQFLIDLVDADVVRTCMFYFVTRVFC